MEIYFFIIFLAVVQHFAYMRSAKQTMPFTSSANHSFADINARLVENFTIKSPLSGWLKSVNIRLIHKDIDVDCAVACLVSNFEDWGEIDDINPLYLEIMNVWDTGVKSGSVMAPNTPFYHLIRGHTTSNLTDGSDYIIDKTKNIGKIVNQGDNINVHYFLNDLGNTLATGSIEWTVEFNFLVGAMSHMNEDASTDRGSMAGAEVALMASLSNAAHNVFWTPPSNGRISNIRLTNFTSQYMNEQHYIYFGKGLFTDLDVDLDEIQLATKGLYLRGGLISNSSDTLVHISTAYTRDIEFVKKGELMQLFLNTDISTVQNFLLEFDFIPDFDKNVDFVYAGELDNFTDGIDMRVFMIPFETYLETGEFDFRMNDQTVDLDIRILGLKDLPEVLSLAQPISGNILGSSGVADNVRGVVPSSILESIAISAGGQIPVDMDPFDIFDYYPAGSFIAIIFDAETGTNTEDLDFTLKLDGKSRVKSSFFGFNYLKGAHIFQEEIEI